MHPTLTRLRKIMMEKQTNLCVAADVVLVEEVLELAETLGEKICLFKTHIDILRDFTPEFTEKLSEIARRKNFLIFEDRKFADIGNTVSLQFAEGIYKIAEWADFVNAHTIVGEGIIQGLQKVNQRSGLILLAQMTPQGNLFSESYALRTVEMARAYPDFVVGFIGSADRPEALQKIRKEAGEDLLILTPGIQLASGGDSLGQTYNTPEKAVRLGADVIIVGRGITSAADPVAEAEKYREAGWVASRK